MKHKRYIVRVGFAHNTLCQQVINASSKEEALKKANDADGIIATMAKYDNARITVKRHTIFSNINYQLLIMYVMIFLATFIVIML